MKNMYVGNLSFNVSDENLHDEFAKYGEVTSAKIIRDAVTHQSRGFGFVEMANDAQAAEAIAGLNGATLGGRTIVVNEARQKREQAETRGGKRRFRRFGT